MYQINRMDSLDDIAIKCCTLAAVHPGIICYIICKYDEQQHLRETIFKENLRLGTKFIWYEMRRETVVGDQWSRVRLLPIEGNKKMREELAGISCDVIGMKNLDLYAACCVNRHQSFYVMYVDDPDGCLEEILREEENDENEEKT